MAAIGVSDPVAARIGNILAYSLNGSDSRHFFVKSSGSIVLAQSLRNYEQREFKFTLMVSNGKFHSSGNVSVNITYSELCVDVVCKRPCFQPGVCERGSCVYNKTDFCDNDCFCNKEILGGVEWLQTPCGEKISAPCSGDAIGRSTRSCIESSFSTPDNINCHNVELLNLIKNVSILEGEINPEGVLVFATKLQDLTNHTASPYAVFGLMDLQVLNICFLIKNESTPKGVLSRRIFSPFS